MKKYYFEIIKKGISTCIDSDVSYYHHFKIGEIICISDYYNPKLIYIMNNNKMWRINYEVSFVSNDIISKKLSITDCIYYGYFLEVTKGFEMKELRDKKLNELGI